MERETRAKQYLRRKLNNNYTRKDLLYLATVLHDIGKPETLFLECGITSCPEHETAGAEKSIQILERFDLSEREKDFVRKIIQHHGKFCVAYKENPKEDYKQLEKEHPNIFLESILFEIADTLGLKKLKEESVREEQKKMVDFYQMQLDLYFSRG